MIAISSAFKRALIGVNIEGKRGYRELDSNCKHSENILPALDSVMQEIGAAFEENDCYALVVGPGSFTGLRIGISLVKGFLAGSGNKNIVTLTTLELMAYTYIKKYQPKENFYCVIDALSNLYYVCQFTSEGKKVGKEELISGEELEKLGLNKIGLTEEKVVLANELVEPTAEELLELALIKEESKEFTSPKDLAPLYLRKSQAEASLDEKNKK